MLFPATRQYAINWIGQIFNYAVTIAFFTLLMSLQMKIFDNHIKNLIVDEGMWANAAQIFMVLPVFLLITMIFGVVAFCVPSISSALTGGAGVGGFSNMVNLVRQLNGGHRNTSFGTRAAATTPHRTGGRIVHGR